MKNITDEEFAKLSEAILLKTTEKFKNLSSQVNYYWGKINDRTYDFT